MVVEQVVLTVGFRETVRIAVTVLLAVQNERQLSPHPNLQQQQQQFVRVQQGEGDGGCSCLQRGRVVQVRRCSKHRYRCHEFHHRQHYQRGPRYRD